MDKEDESFLPVTLIGRWHSLPGLMDDGGQIPVVSKMTPPIF